MKKPLFMILLAVVAALHAATRSWTADPEPGAGVTQDAAPAQASAPPDVGRSFARASANGAGGKETVCTVAADPLVERRGSITRSALFGLLEEIEDALRRGDERRTDQAIAALERWARSGQEEWRLLTRYLLALPSLDLEMRATIQKILLESSPGGHATTALNEELAQGERDAAEAVARSGRAALIRSILDPADTEGAIAALRALPSEWAEDPHLVRALSLLIDETSDDELVVHAVYRLGQSGDPAVVPQLLEISDRYENPRARAGAVRALGRFADDPRSNELFHQLLANPSEPAEIHRFAVQGLARDPASPTTIEILDGASRTSADPQVRRQAMSALFTGSHESAAASAALVRALSSSANAELVTEVGRGIAYSRNAMQGRGLVESALELTSSDATRSNLEAVLELIDERLAR